MEGKSNCGSVKFRSSKYYETSHRSLSCSVECAGGEVSLLSSHCENACVSTMENI